MKDKDETKERFIKKLAKLWLPIRSKKFKVEPIPVLFAVGCGVLFWLLESFLHIFIFHEGTLIQQIFAPEPHEIWMRLIAISIIIVFGIYVQFIINRRKQEEEKIKYINKELDLIFNTAADGMRLIDKNFNVLRVNKTLSDMSGRDKKSVLGKKCYDTFYGTYCHTANCSLSQILEGAKRTECDVDKERSDGTKVSCIVTAIPFYKPGGDESNSELIGIIEDFKDITERKESEEALLKSEERFRNLVETTSDWIWEIDKNCKYTYASPKIHTILGYEPEEMIGKTPFDFMPPEEAKRVTAIFDPFAIEKKHFKELENLNLHKDGHQVILETSGVPFFAEDGTFLGCRGIGRNITERKKTEKELEKHRFHLEKLIKERTVELTNANEQLHREIEERIRAQKDLKESEIKYSTLVEQAKDWVIIVQDGIFKFSNKAIQGLLGYTVEEMIEKPLLDIIISDCKDSDTQESKPCCLTSGKVNLACETKMKHKDGKIIDVEASTGIIQYNGKPSTLGIIRNVTERKKMEEELLKIQKLESLGVLAGGIAHDFNNLLTGIIGNLSMAELYVRPGDKAFDILARAKKASQHAGQLTNQLLTFSKGGAPIRKLASISELVKETADFALRGSKVKCESFMPDTLWAVKIDTGQISQVISNLIINADHAMPNGGIIRVSAENVLIRIDEGLPLGEGKYIKISVKDKGNGIPEEYLLKIFDPYFTTKENGSGLGLATCYAIINKHGGYITAESEVGVGTTFHIYLPASEKEFFKIKEIVEEAPPRPGRGKILFMDDEQDVIDTAGEMLIELGYEVEIAKKGNEAIQLYKKAKESGASFDAVILDLTVPGGMGGIDAIQKLRELDPEIKAIVSSGYSNDPIMSEFKKYGFCGVIAKPYEIKELSNVLYNLINGKEMTV